MAKPGEIERMTAPHIITPKVPNGPPFVPPLEPGDQLTRDEFERRYEAMPHLKKAELLEGIVHIPSPVRWNRHGEPHADLIGCLFVYRASTPGVHVGDNCSVRLDMDSEPQPDAAMIIEPNRGGRVQISSDDYVVGGPELVAEVAASSVSIDRNRSQGVLGGIGGFRYSHGSHGCTTSTISGRFSRVAASGPRLDSMAGRADSPP